MKRIIAFIKPNMQDDVIFALHRIEDFPGATISEVRGIGRGIHHHATGDAARRRSFGFPVSVRLEIVCPTNLAEEIVSAIASEAHTGLAGDGKIIICPVEDALRIRTGERGDEAI
ncbi:MAG: P-II family nitrogen regulator [Victivallales bacterium]|nr:P-II family nitrogen regulator [Victivallales bacterium]